MRSENRKFSLQVQPVGNIGISGRNIEQCLKSDSTCHYRRIGVNSQLKQVLNLSLRDCYIELDVAALGSEVLTTAPVAVSGVLMIVARTGCKYVSPLVPSTIA